MSRPPAMQRLVLPLLSAALAAGTAAAQPPAGGPPGGAGQQRAENLKVLPKDLSRDSVTRIMRGISMALGVRCQYCHVQEPAPAAGAGGAPEGGPPRERFRFAADDKREKETARFMMRMTDSLNRVVLAALRQRHDPPVRVTCATCHHGSPLPQSIDVVLAEAIERQGVDSAIARYRRLRADMVSGRYDFTEVPVTDLAQALAGRGKTAEAVALLQMNQEFNPGSAEIDLAFAEVYRRAGDRGQAIARYRAVLVKRPNDQRARQRLQELGADAVRKDP